MDGDEAKFQLLRASILRRCRERDLLEEEYGERFGRRPVRTSKIHKRDGDKPARARFGSGRIR